MDLTVSIYRWTETFPDEEKYGLTAQMRRSAVSVPSNVAEGWGLHTRASLLKHVRIARGSIAELETQMELAQRLEYLQRDSTRELASNLGRVAQLARGLEQYLDNAA